MDDEGWIPMSYASRDDARGLTTYSAVTSAVDPEVQLIDALWQILSHQEPDVARRALRYLSQRFSRDGSNYCGGGGMVVNGQSMLDGGSDE